MQLTSNFIYPSSEIKRQYGLYNVLPNDLDKSYFTRTLLSLNIAYCTTSCEFYFSNQPKIV